MPTTPVRFRVPGRCKLCGALGTVSPETTITAGSVRLTWCCRACGREWPITRAEQQIVERRSGNAERRSAKRNERRKT